MRVGADDIDLAARVAALLGRALGPDETVAVAVSGGPDSLALLLLAREAFGARTHALTVDHGLRPESAAEAAHVAAICAGLGVPQTTLAWAGPKPAANRQAAARAARYRLMTAWCGENGVGLLLTAHHRDDQAETLLMRLARGSGGAGLAGIRPVVNVNSKVTILRPLLDVGRNTLKSLVEAAKLDAVDDPANRDPAYDRTAARAALAATPWLDPARLAASAAHLGEAETALAWAADLAWRGRAAPDGPGWRVDVAGLPAELLRRVVVRALAELGVDAPDGPSVARLTAALAARGTTTLGGIRAQGGEVWRFAPAPPHTPVRSR